MLPNLLLQVPVSDHREVGIPIHLLLIQLSGDVILLLDDPAGACLLPEKELL